MTAIDFYPGLIADLVLGKIEKELEAEKARVAQLEVQLASCSAAALGHTDPNIEAGTPSWSPAFEDVRKLRSRHDEAVELLKEARAKSLEEENDWWCVWSRRANAFLNRLATSIPR